MVCRISSLRQQASYALHPGKAAGIGTLRVSLSRSFQHAIIDAVALSLAEHLADFNLQHDTTTGTWHLSASNPGSSTPFFKVSVNPITLISSISGPFTSKITGSFGRLVLPPLPQGDLTEVLGTTQWCALTPAMKGYIRFASVAAEIGGKVADGDGFPAVVTWSTAVCLEGVDFEFGVPVVKDSF